MAFNVNDFTSDMSSLGGGLARANMFRVSITNPTGFRTFDNWTVTIINDEEYAHRLWIQNWMYSIAGMPDGTRAGIGKSSL